jgi:hypothetical protein
MFTLTKEAEKRFASETTGNPNPIIKEAELKFTGGSDS